MPHFTGAPPTEAELRLVFPNYDQYPDSFLVVLPFLLASLVFVSLSFRLGSHMQHSEYILATYSELAVVTQNKLFTTPGLLDAFKARVQTGVM